MWGHATDRDRIYQHVRNHYYFVSRPKPYHTICTRPDVQGRSKNQEVEAQAAVKNFSSMGANTPLESFRADESLLIISIRNSGRRTEFWTQENPSTFCMLICCRGLDWEGSPSPSSWGDSRRENDHAAWCMQPAIEPKAIWKAL